MDKNGGNDDWINIQGYISNDLSLTAVITPLDPGLQYDFRYRAKNAHGWGEYSPISSVLLANRPDTITVVTTTHVGALVEIAWDLTPNDRYSSVIDYRIKIKRSDGILIEHSTCNG